MSHNTSQPPEPKCFLLTLMVNITHITEKSFLSLLFFLWTGGVFTQKSSFFLKDQDKLMNLINAENIWIAEWTQIVVFLAPVPDNDVIKGKSDLP